VTPDEISLMVMDAVRDHTMNTTRSQQAASYLLGPSDLGSCREYIRLMILETERDDMPDPKWAAFIGTHLGDALETAVSGDDRVVGTQVPIQAELPSGRRTAGTADLLFADGVGDYKAKDGLETIKREGPSFTHLVQINIYLLGAIQMGLVPEDATWSLIYYDRSGRDPKPHVVQGVLDLDLINQMESRLDDVEYAVIHDEPASKDEPETFCRIACPFWSKCWQGKSDATGLIEDEGAILAIKNYRAGVDLIKEGERLKDESKARLTGVTGSTGEYVVRWVNVGPTEIKGFTRQGFTRLDVRPVRRTKK